MIPLQLVGNLPSLAVALFIAGMTIAPTMVTTMALVEQLVPRAKLTEGMTWTGTGLTAGVAPGSSAAGRAVDPLGTVPMACPPRRVSRRPWWRSSATAG